MANDGGHAFPFTEKRKGEGSKVERLGHPGMSLRDYMAAAALPACITCNMELAKRGMTQSHEEVAKAAYSYADAMLAARERSDA